MSEIENLKIYGGATYTVGNENIIANEWEASKTYVKGKSYVINEHKLYVCNTTHTSTNPFDPTNWTEITVGDAIANNTTAIGSLSTLTTTDKSSLVGAVNEVNGACGFKLSNSSTWHDVSANITAGNYYDTPADGLYVLALAAIDTRAAEWSINGSGIIANTTTQTAIMQLVYLKSGTRLTTRNIAGQVYQVRGYWT